MSILIEVSAKLHIHITKELDEWTLQDIMQELRYRDPKVDQLRLRGFPTWGMDRYIQTYTDKRDKLVCWRGAIKKVTAILTRHHKRYTIIDKRLVLPKIPMPCSIDLREYQREPVATMLRKKQAVGRGAAGSGKTECLLYVISQLEQPTLVLVWQERQQMVWIERISKYFQFAAGGFGGAFANSPNFDSPIVIGLVQTALNILPAIRSRFGCVICDEVNRFAAPTLRYVINNMPAAYRFGASDDERRKDGREFLIYDTFGPLAWKLAQDEGQCNVKIFLVPTEHKPVSSNWTELVSGLLADKHRNQIILDLIVKEVSDGRRILVWSDRVEYCKWLKQVLFIRGIHAGLILGGKTNKAEADRTEQGLLDGTLEVGIGTSVAEQSINIPPLDRGIMVCPTVDRKLYRFRQMRGRLARPFEDKDSRLYYIWDRQDTRLRYRPYALRKQYQFTILRRAKMNNEQVAVTLETLRKGCSQLGLVVPKGPITLKKLEDMLIEVLRRDKTYGDYSCSGCFRDITKTVHPCPFCNSKFLDMKHEEAAKIEEAVAEEPEESEVPYEDDEEIEEELEQEGEEEIEEELEEEPEEEVEEPEEEVEEDIDEGAEEEEWEDDEFPEDGEEEPEEELEEEPEEELEEEPEEELEGDGDEELEEEPEEELEKPAKKKYAFTKKTLRKQEAARKKLPKKAPQKHVKDKIAEKKELSIYDRDTIKQERIKQIKSELPYSEKQLLAMKRTTVIMVASILKIPNPINIGSAEKLIKMILAAQKKIKFPKPQPPQQVRTVRTRRDGTQEIVKPAQVGKKSSKLVKRSK